jgi:hypothetical protein
MRTFNFYDTACFDPVTLTMMGTLLGGLGGAGSAAMSIFGPKAKTPDMPAAAPPVQQPVGTPGGTSSTASQGTPSFLAAAASPSALQLGSKSLLGQ